MLLACFTITVFYRLVTGHSTVEVVLKHYFRPKREEFRHALESSLPKALTGGAEERFDLSKEVLERRGVRWAMVSGEGEARYLGALKAILGTENSLAGA